MTDLTASLKKELQALKEKHLFRTLRVMQSSPDAHVMLDGRPFVNFASNNYLGLANDDRLKRAAMQAIERWGAGATASRLLGGTTDLHARLEDALARFKRTEAAAVFPSGYHANLGTLPALMGAEDTVLLDRLCHASLIDGARMSRARLKVFRHNDPEDLERTLQRIAGRGRKWIVTESAFSMDGDVAPLPDIVSLAKRYGACTYVDEAHATGVSGPEGRGIINQFGLEKDVDVCMGTLSKALGGMGGFVCGNRTLVEWIHNRCRSFIYSTALSPACAASALTAIGLCLSDSARRQKLFRLSARLRQGLGLEPASRGPAGPIIPYLLGSEKAALRLSKSLWEKGVFAPAIRPPTVPKGTARLRFSLTANHSDEDVDAVIRILRHV
ncbi:MAG: 8-amino-7-oxononanoate synthase [Elusimicrobia bacterium]|nr:8-amino-7-oxononanoate synthase [Elusimicrobiota bacterium]